MQFGNSRGSGNIEDRRGIGMGGGLGIGGVVIAIVAAFLGLDPGAVLNTVNEVAPQSAPSGKQPTKGTPADAQGRFVSQVLESTEQVWGGIFKQQGRDYKQPILVLYEGGTRTACGLGKAAMGPFYCPNDNRLYIDLGFFRDLQQRFRAPGDFAQAYVIAHEVAHHVQNQYGILGKLHQMQGRVSQSQYNQYSVRAELQADCFAGVWAHHAGNMNQLDAGDIEEGLNAASAIGDDRLQKQSQGHVTPESFTHGSSAQRVRWFKRGMDSGKVEACDTFGAGSV